MGTARASCPPNAVGSSSARPRSTAEGAEASTRSAGRQAARTVATERNGASQPRTAAGDGRQSGSGGGALFVNDPQRTGLAGLLQDGAVDHAVARNANRADTRDTLFVHFIPPPLRAPKKKDLPWIVHTCDGSGCREARHVHFSSVTGFETYEGAPPEQAAGNACSCAISNHHLRGYGRVRWDGDEAFVEDVSGGHEAVVAALSEVEAKARKADTDLSRSREQVIALKHSEHVLTEKLFLANEHVKALRDTERQLREQLAAAQGYAVFKARPK